ncbi:MAG: hypothetical protein CL693_00360 [Cellvibrionaceae bacterium]|nr:hypothetical protein [Cellvibrionaceae bacterium]
MSRKPARKIKASAVKNICKFPSTKSFCEPSHRTFKMVLVESLLEKDYCFHLEADSNVSRYYPQPKTLRLNSQYLKNREYTPDFEVHFRDGGRAFVEVKKDFNTLDEIYLHKLQLASVEMQRSGYDFLCVDERQIRVQPLLSNLKRLQRYRGPSSNNSGALSLLKSSIPAPKILNDLLENPLGIRLETIYRFIANGQIVADLSEIKLSLNAEVHYA